MIPFDAAKAFGKVALVLLGAALLAVPYVGWWLFIPVGIILYYTLKFYNQLEARDRREFRQAKKHKRQ